VNKIRFTGINLDFYTRQHLQSRQKPVFIWPLCQTFVLFGRNGCEDLFSAGLYLLIRQPNIDILSDLNTEYKTAALQLEATK